MICKKYYITGCITNITQKYYIRNMNENFIAIITDITSQILHDNYYTMNIIITNNI